MRFPKNLIFAHPLTQADFQFRKLTEQTNIAVYIYRNSIWVQRGF